METEKKINLHPYKLRMLHIFKSYYNTSPMQKEG